MKSLQFFLIPEVHHQNIIWDFHHVAFVKDFVDNSWQLEHQTKNHLPLGIRLQLSFLLCFLLPFLLFFSNQEISQLGLYITRVWLENLATDSLLVNSALCEVMNSLMSGSDFAVKLILLFGDRHFWGLWEVIILEIDPLRVGINIDLTVTVRTFRYIHSLMPLVSLSSEFI